MAALMSNNREISDLVHNIVCTNRVTSWNEQLRENESPWRLPLWYFPEFPCLCFVVDTVVENSLLVCLSANWRNLRQWCSTLFKNFTMEFLTIICFKQSCKSPSQTIYKVKLKDLFINWLLF